MFEKEFFSSLKETYQKNESERRQIISASNNILFESKKIIFALQKEDKKKAEKALKDVKESFISLQKKFNIARLNKEGAFKAAAEEYLEAYTFYQATCNKKIGKIKDIDFEYDSYLGGVCDMVGELVRFSTNKAAQGKFSSVSDSKKKAEIILEELSDFDMTGYLRTKYDQARGHLRKLEQMAYEIKIRNRK